MFAEKTIRKHVTIIHAYSLMSVLQRKIVNVLLYEAIKGDGRINNHQNSVAVECNMPFSKLSKAVKFNSNNTQYLKESIDGLASLKIEWNLLKDKVPTDISFLNLRVLHGAPTFYQDNTINFSFHKIMLDLLVNPSIYGTIDIDLQSEFESKYGHALYENSTRFINLQKNKIIQLDTFRKILGVPEHKYPSMRELTRNVISPSLEEVNDRANFVVSLEPIRVGRKVIGFEVLVQNKKNTTISEVSCIDSENEKINKEIKATFGILNGAVLENIINNYSEEYIQEKINYTKKYAKKELTGFYPIPYFISALKYDYKFKEEPNPEGSQKKLSNEEIEWEKKLFALQAELNHWEKLSGYTKAGDNQEHIKNMQKFVLESQEKLKKHYLEKPTKREAV
ncbi:TPA: RepB family plasmid replication initiator protein [Legionella pneumophila]|uniref:Initiator Replication protein n=1 Tax=Legionella bozemanae TaxID=447 RepID=A0A0W0RBJ4_LEGBO|nr:RepB family plasmid replication initiator protein [Legionella bozemanae]KTC68410.1 Initiator Replication protein [Legionella bozemanae]STP10113.1 Protein involved in initiation of plasmid replication [Legionella bozemanae]HAT1722254.1 RepB family plasmid replication initiator protein [Legionella pneumophila]